MSGEPEPVRVGGVTFTRIAGRWQAGAEGWARTTTNLEHDMLEEIVELRARVAELEAEKERAELDAAGDNLDRGL